MSDLPEKTRALIKVLASQTSDGRRQWQKGSADTEFVFVHDSGSVIISSVDEDGGYPFELRVVDAAGRIVENYVSTTQGEGFEALYSAARKSGVRASNITETLLEELTQDDIPF